ncbi:MAG: saccharopine dehydrogenase NADP-binding domain-containing protein [Chitinophagales bacterium]|jgi:saccharopine dehydrogenase-like NADP-dependent oxidoreductase|nr:saccharopine dehydrogenase NADP-binding domain-containing protein [Chitinophagales bacterium]
MSEHRILLVAAGKSAHAFLDYFAAPNLAQFHIHILDLSPIRLQERYQDTKRFTFTAFNIEKESINPFVAQADIVISMLPPSMHYIVLESCISFRKPMLTPSYQSQAMLDKAKDIDDSGILVVNELGLDPGLDHITSMVHIEEMKSMGYEIYSYYSVCGGLVDDACDNEWQYKFSWNPKNVVQATQGGHATYLYEGREKIITAPNIFRRYHTLQIGEKNYDIYANRDSVSYQAQYGLTQVSNLFRGTIRKKNFVPHWLKLVEVGLTDTQSYLNFPENTTLAEFYQLFLPDLKQDELDKWLKKTMISEQDDLFLEKFIAIGLTEKSLLPLTQGSPAEIFQAILEQKWQLADNDRDLVVMYHEIKGKNDQNLNWTKKVFFERTGHDAYLTAMSQTVSMPLICMVELILSGTFHLKGLHLPTHKEIYKPIYARLKEFNLEFEYSEEKQDNAIT